MFNVINLLLFQMLIYPFYNQDSTVIDHVVTNYYNNI